MKATFWTLLAACLFLGSVSAQQFSDWSAPVNQGPIVNSPVLDGGAFITKDGLSLYIVSNRPGGFGGNDIWVVQRDSTEDPWGVPQNLGSTINTAGNDVTPTVSIDGHWLYFASDGRNGLGAGDLYVSRRRNKRDDFAWGPAVSLGDAVNSAGNETGPALFEDETNGTRTLYFNSNRSGNDDIYVSTLESEGTFGTAMLVPELSTEFSDLRPAIRRHGLEMFFDSDRPGGVGALDIWVTRRASINDPWGEPENLGPGVNSSAIEGRAAISFDGSALYFLSARPGGFGAQDIYLSTRRKLKAAENGTE